MHKIGAISIDASLKILAGTRSGPEALAGLRLLRSFTIPGTDQIGHVTTVNTQKRWRLLQTQNNFFLDRKTVL